jgi:hypothetical protein
VTEPTFFETPAVWDTELETFLVESEDTVEIEPQLPAYEGPIVVLVDAYTQGPAESFAEFLQGRENVRIYGDADTYGSPGTPNLELTLPGGYIVYLPTRRTLDQEGKIQGTADASGAGAVQPQAPFVLDRANGAALFQQRKDVVLDKAVEMLDSATWRLP